MPLFMDLHNAADYDVKPTVDEIKKNHIADLAVQEKYGVKFLQYWINEDAGLVFCMMEAPDKEACAAVHREAHGAMPCNVIELKGGDYTAYLTKGTVKNEFDIVERSSGGMDPGHRILVAVQLLSFTNAQEQHHHINTTATEFGGSIVNQPDNQKILVFTNVQSAITCAKNLTMHRPRGSEIRIGITIGEPVTMNAELFGDALNHANRLCRIAANEQIIVSYHLRSSIDDITENIRILDPADEQFMNLLLDSLLRLLNEENCSVEVLSKELGMSKSGLYRKLQSLSGTSGNSFIQELRMQKAFRLIQNKQGNVAQISFETGYSNPSYFAKAFRKRFGHSPLSALKFVK